MAFAYEFAVPRPVEVVPGVVSAETKPAREFRPSEPPRRVRQCGAMRCEFHNRRRALVPNVGVRGRLAPALVEERLAVGEGADGEGVMPVGSARDVLLDLRLAAAHAMSRLRTRRLPATANARP